MKRKILIVIIILLALGAGAFYYVNKYVLPSKVRTIITEQVQKFTGRAVTIAAVDFSVLRGFVVHDFTVFDKDLGEPPLFKADSIALRVLYLPILREKKIIIPSLQINRLALSLTRREDGSWNFSDILERQKASQSSKTAFPLIIANITLKNAAVQFTDKTLPVPLKETIGPMNARASLALPKSVKFSLATRIAQSPAVFLMEGSYDLSASKLSAHTNLQNISLVKYLTLYYSSPQVTLQNGLIQSADISLQMQKKEFHAKVKASLTGMDAKALPDKKITGNASIELNVDYNPSLENPWRYAGFVDLNNTALSGIPYISTLEGIDGKIFLEPERAKTDALVLLWHGNKIQLVGTVTNFKAPEIDVHGASTDIDLKEITSLFPKYFEERKINVSGRGNFTLDYSGPLHAPVSTHLRATALLTNAALSLPKPEIQITGIGAKIHYKNDTATLENFNGLLEDAKIQGSATLSNFDAPVLEMRAFSPNIDTKKLGALFPQLLKKASIKTITGPASLNINFNGLLHSFPRENLNATALLDHITVETEKLPGPVTDITGKIVYRPDGISWEDIKGVVSGTSYTLSGKLINLAAPSINTTLESQDLDVTVKASLDGDNIAIASLNGTYHNLAFNLRGNVMLARLKEPTLNLTGNVKFNLRYLEELATLFPSFKEKITQLKPNGLCTFQGSFKGQPSNWRNWQITGDLTSPQLSLSGYSLDNFVLRPSQSNDGSQQYDLTADFCDGQLNATAIVSLVDEELPFRLQATLENANIAKWKNNADTAVRNQNISGTLSADIVLYGALENLDSSEGQGSLLISNGRIWELNLLKGLGQFLFIPEFKDIVFNEAKGEFFIDNGKVTTNDFQLLSPQATLMCSGWIDFLGNINFEILSDFSEDLIADSSSLKKAVTAILTQGDAYLTIRLTGTLKEPKYTLLPTGVLKKTKNLIIDGIKSIFTQE